MRVLLSAFALMQLTSPAFAEGDVANGESLFSHCKSCHEIADGDNLMVRGGRSGPNLFAIIGAPAAAGDFRYSDGMRALAEAGVVWTEANFVAWVTDPGQFLTDTLGVTALRIRKTFQLASGAEDIAAYLASLNTQ
mgnify:CR=1 FL=1